MRRESSLLVKQQAVRPLRPGVHYSGFVLLAKGSFKKYVRSILPVFDPPFSELVALVSYASLSKKGSATLMTGVGVKREKRINFFVK